MRAGGLATVVKVGSKVSHTKEGDLVAGFTGWAEYAVVKGSSLRKINPVKGIRTSEYLGVLGATGQTAYWGLEGKESSLALLQYWAYFRKSWQTLEKLRLVKRWDPFPRLMLTTMTKLSYPYPPKTLRLWYPEPQELLALSLVNYARYVGSR